MVEGGREEQGLNLESSKKKKIEGRSSSKGKNHDADEKVEMMMKKEHRNLDKKRSKKNTHEEKVQLASCTREGRDTRELRTSEPMNELTRKQQSQVKKETQVGKLKKIKYTLKKQSHIYILI